MYAILGYEKKKNTKQTIKKSGMDTHGTVTG